MTSAIGRRGAAWWLLSAGLDSRLIVALSDQRDQRGSMQRLSTAVTNVLHVQLLAALYGSSVQRDCSDQRGDAALVDHGAVPVLRRCLRDAQHAVTCCDSVLWHAVSQHDAVTSCIVLHRAVMRQYRAV